MRGKTIQSSNAVSKTNPSPNPSLISRRKTKGNSNHGMRNDRNTRSNPSDRNKRRRGKFSNGRKIALHSGLNSHTSKPGNRVTFHQSVLSSRVSGAARGSSMDHNTGTMIIATGGSVAVTTATAFQTGASGDTSAQATAFASTAYLFL